MTGLSFTVACFILLIGAAGPAVAADRADMEGMDMSMEMSMHGFYGRYPMSREASGTSWVPESTPLEGVMGMYGEWMAMVQGYADLVYDDQGGRRGTDKTFLEGMLMGMASHPLGGGTIGFRSMFSPDPFMGKDGYPLLLQTGETANGVDPLIDRQHPHNLIMELAATYSHPITADSSVFIYLADPGEPALGPTTFMDRFSGMDNPEAPISHHWLDSTHIIFGVATVGYVWKNWKLDASVFTGREPDQYRYGFNRATFDSFSGRLTYNPSPNWSLQVSGAHLKSPEQLSPEVNQDRTTASATYNLPIKRDNWQTTLAWGVDRNTPGKTLNAFLLESAIVIDNQHTVFGRAEHVGKDELFTPIGSGLPTASVLYGQVFTVSTFSLGYIYDLLLAQHVKFGLGGLVSFYALPDALTASYGHPVSYMVFGRVKLD
jgi:hypothetical protein